MLQIDLQLLQKELSTKKEKKIPCRLIIFSKVISNDEPKIQS